MKKYIIYNMILFSLIILFTNSCVEEFDIKTISFKSVLVIEATITNEFKHHKISLSKTFKLEEDGPLPESNANVKITDDLNNTYFFSESNVGEYISNNAFKAISNRNYQLLITTSDGKSYSSKPTQLTSNTQIDKIYASKEIDNFRSENISIFLDSFDPTGNSKYYRYEYEETFKIIAPKWNAYDLIVVPNGSRLAVKKFFKTKEERVCFNTIKSNSIIQAETNGFSEDRISKLPIRVLSKSNTIISHRYSILIKQYVQSFEAYTFYKTIKKLSGSESLFSQNQPGFFSGNIFSVNNPDEKVVGFFEVSSVSISQRLFFNFQDFFPNDDIPPYFSSCDISAPSNASIFGEPSLLVELLNSGTVKYLGPNPNYPNPLDENEGPYLMVESQCGDCTKIGSNVKPDFWIE